MGRLASFATISCAVNPACGRENEYGLQPASESKTVMIIGGGVAGCEAARVCAIRGHKVTLFEKTDKLGGNIIPGGVPDFKEDDRELARWYTAELNDLKVTLRFNTEVTKEIVKETNAAVVIVATGSIPKMLKIGHANNVYTAEEVLLGKKAAGNSTIIIGGGLVGCETALWLADQGKQVTLVEMQNDILKIGGPLCHANEDMLRDLVKFKKIDVRLNTVVAGATANGFLLKSGSKEESVVADSAIVSIGYNSQRSLYDEIKFNVPQIYLLGDASQVQNIMYAIWNAYEVARNI
jgi:2-enoate reductase